MEKRSVVRDISFWKNGQIFVTFEKQIVDDDGEVIFKENYRTSVSKPEELDAAIAFANERLSLKHAPVDTASIDWLDEVKPVAKEPVVKG